MSKFVLCSSFLSGCLEDAAFYCDILFEFPKDNDLVVYADAPQVHVIDRYRQAAAADESGILSVWLKCMINRSALNFEFIDSQAASDGALFFSVASGVGPNTPMIVWSMERWKALIDAHPHVTVLDRLEGRKSVRRVLQGKEWKKVTTRRRAGDININAQNVNANINSQGAQARQHIDGHHEQAIRDISAFTDGQSREVLEQAERLKTQLASREPDKGVVQEAWSRLVSLAPKITAVASAVTAVGKVLNWG